MEDKTMQIKETPPAAIFFRLYQIQSLFNLVVNAVKLSYYKHVLFNRPSVRKDDRSLFPWPFIASKSRSPHMPFSQDNNSNSLATWAEIYKAL